MKIMKRCSAVSWLLFAALVPGVATSSDKQERANELVGIHSTAIPIRGSGEEFAISMRAASRFISLGVDYGLSNSDLEIMQQDVGSRGSESAARDAMRPYFVEIRDRLHEADATEELAELLMAATDAESAAVDDYYRALYGKLSDDGKNRVDTAIGNFLTHEMTIHRTDFARMAVDEPELVHAILESAVVRFFNPPEHGRSEETNLRVTPVGDSQ